MNLTAGALFLGAGYMIGGEFAREEVLDALEALEKESRGFSRAALAILLRMLIENENGKAFDAANEAVSNFAQFPLLSRLFDELAEGISSRDEEKKTKALVKLFYYHV